MKFEGVLSAKNVGALTKDISSERSTLLIDLTAVDRVEHAALATILVVAARTAYVKRPLRVICPSIRLIGNEPRHIQAGRAIGATQVERWARESAIRRQQRRVDLRKELIRNGFFECLEEVYAMHSALDLLHLDGLPTSLDVDRPAEWFSRSIPFQWVTVPAQATDPKFPLSAKRLADVLSNSESSVSDLDAADLADVVVHELIQNVNDHAFPIGWDGPALILVGAVALNARQFDKAYGSAGLSAYSCNRDVRWSTQVIELTVADTGQGIPATLTMSEDDDALLEDWIGKTIRSSSARRVTYAFHPLSTSRSTLPPSRPRFRGLSFVNKLVRRYSGEVRATSTTASVRWQLSPGSRRGVPWNHSELPGTQISVSISSRSSQSRIHVRPSRLRSAKVEVRNLTYTTEDEGLAALIDVQHQTQDGSIVAFTWDPPHSAISPDRAILEHLNVLDLGVNEWNRPLPWFCVVPVSTTWALSLLAEDVDLPAAPTRTSNDAVLRNPVLIVTLEGDLLWIGGTLAERAAMARATGLGEGVLSPPAAGGRTGPTPRSLWLENGEPIAGALDIRDALTSELEGVLRAFITTASESDGQFGTRRGPILIDSLQVATNYLDLPRVLKEGGLVTATAWSISRRILATVSNSQVVHTPSFPANVARLIRSKPIGEWIGESDAETTSGPILVLDGIRSSGDSLRGDLSLLVKAGWVPEAVIGILDASGNGDARARAVFHQIPTSYLLSIRMVEPPKRNTRGLAQTTDLDETIRAATSRPQSTGVFDFVDAHPEVVRVGHFVRRRGRHMDVFVEFTKMFGAGDPASLKAQRKLWESILAICLPWWSAEPGGGERLAVAYPADDAARAGAFALWAAERFSDHLGAMVDVVAVPRDVKLGGGRPPLAAETPVVLFDWGAVTTQSLTGMYVNLAWIGYRKSMGIVLTSQLGAQQEVIATAMRAICAPPGVTDDPTLDETPLSIETHFLSHVDLGHASQHECDLCRVVEELDALSADDSLPSAVRTQAADRRAALRAIQLSGDGPPGRIGVLPAVGPRLIALRERLRIAQSDNGEKLALLFALRDLNRQKGFDPLNPDSLAWVQLIASEPRWMARSAIDLKPFRRAIAALCVRALKDAHSPGSNPEANYLYLLGLRICAKDEFLRYLPVLARRPEVDGLLLDGFVLVASFLRRPYHHSHEALGLAARNLEDVGKALAKRTATSDVSVNLTSTLQVLDQLVTLYLIRLDAPESPQHAWRFLQTAYVGPLASHRGLPGDIAALLLITSEGSVLNRMLGEGDADRMSHVRQLLVGPWSVLARSLAQSVLPPLPVVANELLATLELIARTDTAAPEEARGLLDGDVWRRRVLSADPGVYEQAAAYLADLEAGSTSTRQQLSAFHDLLEWCSQAVFGQKQSDDEQAGDRYKSAVLYRVAESIPAGPHDFDQAIREVCASLGLQDRRVQVEVRSDTAAYVSTIVVRGIVERVIENVVHHSIAESLADIEVSVVYEELEGDVSISVLNTLTDPYVPSRVSRRRGLTVAHHLASSFGGSVLTRDPLDATTLAGEWTHAVTLRFRPWEFDIMEGS